MDVMNGIKNTLSPKDIDPDMYRVDDVSQKADKQVGTVTTDRLTNILTEYPDACRAFELTTEAGYQKIPDQNTSKSFAGQTNRNEKPLAPLFEELNEYYDCQIRLDTVDPQVIIVTNELTEIHIEIDTSVIQWIPPADAGSA